MNVNLVQKQKGLTMISWLVIIAFLGFQGMVALKVAPPYFNDMTIGSMMKDLAVDPTMAGKPPKKIREIIIKRLKINNVFGLGKDEIKIKKTKYHYLVTIEYEPRGNVMGSLDYIMTFKHEAKIPLR